MSWFWKCSVRYSTRMMYSATGAYSEICQTSEMERFAKIISGFYSLTFFTKRSILDVWHGSAYASCTTFILRFYAPVARHSFQVFFFFCIRRNHHCLHLQHAQHGEVCHSKERCTSTMYVGSVKREKAKFPRWGIWGVSIRPTASCVMCWLRIVCSTKKNLKECKYFVNG